MGARRIFSLEIASLNFVLYGVFSNVAMDISRMMLKSPAELENTDISPYALEELWKSKVERIICVGRRGPAQAAYTIKEFRELTKLGDVRISILDEDVKQMNDDLRVLGKKVRDTEKSAWRRWVACTGVKGIFPLLLSTHIGGENSFKKSLNGPY
jgi:hypothetical protein